jgi:hypothetical protein
MIFYKMSDVSVVVKPERRCPTNGIGGEERETWKNAREGDGRKGKDGKVEAGNGEERVLRDESHFSV